MKLKGKVALVTGGAVRIGAAICRALAAEGARVVIHYRRSKMEAVALAKEIGGFAMQSDLNSEAACERLMEQAVRKAGQLDILVNNAAVFHKDSLEHVTARKLLDEFWPNLFAPILLMRAFAAQAKARKIVNLLDRRIASLDTSCVPYVLTKKALAEFTSSPRSNSRPASRSMALRPARCSRRRGRGRSICTTMRARCR